MSGLISHFQGRQPAMMRFLTELIELESPSRCKTLVDRVGEAIARRMVDIGGSVERIACHGAGDMVLGRFLLGSGPSAAGQGHQRSRILLLCHMDTVWPENSVAQRPIRTEAGRLYGPGAYDMKAGIAIALEVLDYLGESSSCPPREILVLCTGDEEIGSAQSLAVIEELASDAGLVLCLEPPLPGGALKTARKGVGWYTITVKGRSAHAGGNHAQGVNAIEEMAHHVLALQALTDYQRGTTVSVGVISGGSAANVVPDECSVQVDYRVTSMQEAERVAALIEGLSPTRPEIQLRIEGGLNRPPMVRDDVMHSAFTRASEIATDLGLHLAEGSSGGGSDGSFTAAMGVPTLDGLGADGDGAHAINEHILIVSLSERAALLAALLTEWT